MADLFDDPDLYDDVFVRVGCDLVWGFSLEPWDANGTTAVFRVNGTTDFSVVITVTGEGENAISEFDVHLTPTQLTSLGLNVVGATVTYVVLWTASDTSVIAIGNGTVVAQ